MNNIKEKNWFKFLLELTVSFQIMLCTVEQLYLVDALVKNKLVYIKSPRSPIIQKDCFTDKTLFSSSPKLAFKYLRFYEYLILIIILSTSFLFLFILMSAADQKITYDQFQMEFR